MLRFLLLGIHKSEGGAVAGFYFPRYSGHVLSLRDKNRPNRLLGDEVAVLRMTGSLLGQEEELPKDDEQEIRDSIESLRKVLDDSEISKSARTALLELMRLSRNALDQYAIHGARGFKKAFKKMLAELVEVYLKEGEDATSQAWWGPAWQHVKLFDSVYARLSKYQRLLESTLPLLLDKI